MFVWQEASPIPEKGGGSILRMQAANPFGYATVIDDVEHREAPIRDQTPESVDGLCDGLAAGFASPCVKFWSRRWKCRTIRVTHVEAH
jgi:hypothetical protein